MPIGPTRVEVIGDLIDVVQADYSRAITKKRSTCMDCSGAGIHVMDTDEGGDSTVTCARCNGAGYEEVDEFDNDGVPEELRPFITGYKAGFKGKLLPEFRNKDKAASELMKAISNGWLADFKRNAFGEDAPAEETVDLSRDAVILQYQRIAMSSDPATAMQALNAICKLQGYVDEDAEGVDNEPLTMGQLTEFMNRRLKANGHRTADESAAALDAQRRGEVDGEGNEVEPLDPRDVIE